jgi:hypothetical protein
MQQMLSHSTNSSFPAHHFFYASQEQLSACAPEQYALHLTLAVPHDMSFWEHINSHSLTAPITLASALSCLYATNLDIESIILPLAIFDLGRKTIKNLE